MTATSFTTSGGKAITIKKPFYQQTSISIEIDADTSIIWALLTNASDFPRWNSTVTSLEGEIKKGEKIRLKSYLDKKRTFKIKVRELIPEKSMVWGDGQGKRIFKLESNPDSSITFRMSEKIGGFMYPLYAKHLPDFDESFEKFAADLKKEAELIANTKI
ncbi:MAG: SRPBCC domain-containing protein [Flavobacteriaceae bacterium]